MADIELVIKIPEEVYKKAQEIPNARWDAVWLGIKHGTPLPKGHGRLIDCTQLHMALDAFMYGIDGIHEYLDNEQDVPTIIEADSEVKE